VKITKPLLLLLALFLSVYSNAVLAPESSMPSVVDPFKIKPKEIEKLTGKKLTLFEKIKFTVAQKLLKRYSTGEMTPRQKKQAKWSMILGFLGLALLLISVTPALGVLGILSIPAAIIAVILGLKSVKGNSNTEGKIGLITGGITIVLLLAVMLLVALTFSA
jgi:hypothetical protein